MQLLKAREKDVSFIYDCLKLLRGEVVYSEAELRNYLINNSYFEFESMGSEIWIGWNNGRPREC